MNFLYKNNKHIYTTIHILIFTLFLYSGISKLTTFEVFVNNLDKSPILANLNTKLIAVVVIILELFIVAALFFDKVNKVGYFLTFFILLFFTGYILIMMKLSPYLPCSCGGLLDLLSWNQHLVFNILFMAMSAILFFRRTNPQRTI